MVRRHLGSGFLLASFLAFGVAADESLFAFEPKPSCDQAIQNIAQVPSDRIDEETKLARTQLQRSYFFHGSRYDSKKSESAAALLNAFPPAISFSNEAEVWDFIRDRALIASSQHPDRYVVSTGLQQSLEFLFAGVPQLIMTDAYGPNISAFALMSERAKQHSSAENFFKDVSTQLQIIKSTGAGPSSWFGNKNSVEDFLQALKNYGEIGYQRFRASVLRGNVKAFLQDLSDSHWGKNVREMSDGRAPSFIYTSNIANWISSSHWDNYNGNLQTLSIDYDDRPRWFDFSNRKTITFGSLIGLTGVHYTGFTYEIGRLWDLRLGPTRMLEEQWPKYGFSKTAKEVWQPHSTDDLKPLDRSYVRVVSQLTNQIAYEGLLKLHENFVIINNLSGWDIEVAYDPRLHRIEAANPSQPVLDLIQLKGRKVRVKSSKDNQTIELTLNRPQKIIPDGNNFLLRWKVTNHEGRSTDFTFDPKTHEIVEILTSPSR